MLLTILVSLKIILFINMTNIEHNSLTIFLFTALVSILILSGIELLNDKYHKPLKTLFYSVFSLIMFLDMMYYSYFQSLPSVALLGQFGQLGAVADSVAKALTIRTILFIVDLPLVIYYIFKRERRIPLSKHIIKRISVISTLAIIFIASMTVRADKLTILTNQEFYSYHVSDLASKYFAKDIEMDIDVDYMLEMIKEDLKSQRVKEGDKHYGLGRGRNLIVVQMESLQGFVIGLEQNGEEVTPNLNKLIEDKGSLYFDEFFQMIGRGNTSDAEFITNNSLHPSREEPSYIQYENNTFYGLPWILREEGYTAWSFHGFEKDFWNRNRAYPNQGFQRFISEEDFDYEEKILMGISDREFYQQSLDYMIQMDSIDEGPFYSLLITLSSHTPYVLDEKYQVLDIEEPQRGTIVGDYFQAIHYADREFGKFIEELKRQGLYENSVLAVYGDHYGINNADDQVFRPMEEILGEPYNFDHMMKIPLIINIPGEEINEKISKLGSQIDFAPTILNILGIENKKGYMMGKDLVNSEDYNYVAPQRVLRRGSFIDEDIIFNISRDGIFENSTARDRKTRRKLDVNPYRDTYDMIIGDISKSDFILANNLLEDIVEGGGSLDGLELDIQRKIPNQKRIRTFRDYEIKNLEDRYNRGDKITRIYIDRESDLDELEDWMEIKEDAFLILKSKERGTGLLEDIKDEYKELRGRYISQIDDFDDYFLVQRNGFKNILIDTRKRAYTEGEIWDFVSLNKVFGLIAEKDEITKDFARKLEERGIRIYIEGDSRQTLEYRTK